MVKTINGSRGGGSYGPWLELDWTVLSQDVPNNRSQIRLTLKLRADRNISFSASKSGALQGSSFTYTGGMSGAGTRTLATRTLWVNHNSDGNKSLSLSGSLALNITWSGNRINTLSVSGTVSLPKIARQSSFNSVSITENLKSSGGGRLNLDVTNKPSGFYQWVGIYDGNTIVHDWGYNTATPTWWTISGTIAKKMLARMPNSNTKTFTVRVYTYTGNGTGNLGYQSQTFRATVDSSEKPIISNATMNISGNGWDKSNNTYLQHVTKVDASMTSTAPYGTTIATERITVQGYHYNGRSITSSILGTSGSSSIIYRATDSRGNYVEDKRTLTVSPYSAPKLDIATIDRINPESVTVDYLVKGTWNDLGLRNKLKLEIKRKASNSSVWTNMITPQTLTNGKIDTSGKSGGNSISLSYDFKIIVTDDLGRSAERDLSITTARVLMNFHEDKGIGIGKMHERGDLDVAGDVYFEGNIELRPQGSSGRPGFKMISQDNSGHGYIEYYGPDNTRRAYIGIPSATSENLHIYNEQGGNIRLSGNSITANGYEVWSNGTVESGSNSNGEWVRFPDGTQICQHILNISGSSFSKTWGSLYYEYLSPDTWTYPKSFSNNPTVTMNSYNSNMFFANSRVYTSSVTGLIAYRGASGKADTLIFITAIGRWK